jgi:F-type H+-transporting ATPase subunit epsilon
MSFTVRMMSLEKILFEGEATRVDAPGLEGDFGILEKHMPIVSALRAGKISVHTPQGVAHIFEVQGGYLDMLEICTILSSQSVNTSHR